MAEFLKHYSMKIHTLSPVHIGNGEAIGKKEYIYLPWKQIVIIPDIARMYSDMRKKEWQISTSSICWEMTRGTLEYG